MCSHILAAGRSSFLRGGVVAVLIGVESRPTGAASMTRPVAGFVDGLEAALATPPPPVGPVDVAKEVVTPPSVHHRVPLAAIVCGTVGGVCFIALMVCGLLYWRRRTGTRPQPEEVVEAPPVEVAAGAVHVFPNGPIYEMPIPSYEMSGKM